MRVTSKCLLSCNRNYSINNCCLEDRTGDRERRWSTSDNGKLLAGRGSICVDLLRVCSVRSKLSQRGHQERSPCQEQRRLRERAQTVVRGLLRADVISGRTAAWQLQATERPSDEGKFPTHPPRPLTHSAAKMRRNKQRRFSTRSHDLIVGFSFLASPARHQRISSNNYCV
jgi:hypothetical protein